MILHFKNLFSAVLRYGVLSGTFALGAFMLPADHTLVMRLLDSLLLLFSDLGVSFVVLAPSDGFVVQVYLALWIGFFLALPYGFKEIYGFVAPGLYHRERRLLVLVFLFSLILFVLGASFGLIVIMPPSLGILLGFNDLFGVESLYSIRSFMGDLFLVTLFSGIAFMLPVVMVLLTFLRVVPTYVWRDVWRYVVLGVLIVAAVITPDGTGVTMALFAVPVVLLYFLGLGVSYLVERRL